MPLDKLLMPGTSMSGTTTKRGTRERLRRSRCGNLPGWCACSWNGHGNTLNLAEVQVYGRPATPDQWPVSMTPGDGKFDLAWQR